MILNLPLHIQSGLLVSSKTRKGKLLDGHGWENRAQKSKLYYSIKAITALYLKQAKVCLKQQKLDKDVSNNNNKKKPLDVLEVTHQLILGTTQQQTCLLQQTIKNRMSCNNKQAVAVTLPVLLLLQLH